MYLQQKIRTMYLVFMLHSKTFFAAIEVIYNITQLSEMLVSDWPVVTFQNELFSDNDHRQ